MPWTFEQRIQRACWALIDRSLLEESQIEIVRRPLFFGCHAYGVGLSLNLAYWGEWQAVKDTLQRELESRDATLQSNQRTYQLNVFSSDPSVLRWLIGRQSMFTFNHVRVVDRSCWHLRLPRPRPKAKFYGEFGWRFKFKDPAWHAKEENLAQLASLSGEYRLVTSPRAFLYLKNISDVLLFKLIAAEQLLSLEDRHTL